jgi:hypothetical protein
MALLPVPGNCWTVKRFREAQAIGAPLLVHELLEALRPFDEVEFVAIEALRTDAHHRVCAVDIIRPNGAAGLRVSVA